MSICHIEQHRLSGQRMPTKCLCCFTKLLIFFTKSIKLIFFNSQAISVLKFMLER